MPPIPKPVHAKALRDLHLDGRGPAYEQIYRSIRGAILAGRAEAGARLPSSRWLASDLSVSRNTVLAAYEQLLAEGYTQAREGSGTYVAPRLDDEGVARRGRRVGAALREHAPPSEPPRLSRYGRRVAQSRARRVYDALASRSPVRIDFMPCVPGTRALSTESWRRSVSRRLAMTIDGPLGYGEPSGSDALRDQVASYLARARGVACDADDLLVVGGLAQALDLCARVLVDEGDGALIEDPHYVGARRAFEAVGAELVPAPVDAEGIDLSGVPGRALARCRLAYVTPSHQFPTGAVMSLARRLALLDWARQNGAYVIEDDYDSEFRYEGRSIEAMKSLDAADRVLYVGTFSKVLDPALRLAYVVVPKALRGVLRDAKWQSDWASPTFEQEALALFIARGDFERHVRRMRTSYGRQRAALLNAIDRHARDAVTLRDSRTGLHVLVEVPSLPAERTQELVDRAFARDVALYSAAPYYLSKPPTCQLVLGFSLPTPDEIVEGVRVLAATIDELARSDRPSV